MFRKLRHTLNGLRSSPITEVDPLEAYQLWAESYDNVNGNALLYADARAVGPLVKGYQLSGKNVLDAGCGTGRNLEILTQDNPGLVAAADFSPNMVQRLGSKVRNCRSITAQVARLEFLPYKNEQFDFALCTLVLDHIADLQHAVSELSRVLRPGGSMVVSCFHPFGKLLGWQRSFKAHLAKGQEKWFAARYYHHSHSDYYTAFQSTRLEIIGMMEPRIDETLKSFYVQAGRTDLFNRYNGYPFLLIFELRKR
jgi:malonyl-CoA O-methyltransferase